MFDFIKSVVFGRNDYSPEAKRILTQYGDRPIRFMEIHRSPLQIVHKLLNVVSLGKFEKNNPYEKLFHLRIVVQVEGTIISVEKNDVITLKVNPRNESHTEVMPVTLTRQFTINQLLAATRQRMGSKFFPYSAYDNNCQDFILQLLEANGLNSPNASTFVKQDVRQLFNQLGWLRKLANTATDVAGRLDVIRQGGNLSQKNGLTDADIMKYLDNRRVSINGIYSKDQLPNKLKQGWYVINMEDHDEGDGTYWVALLNLEDSKGYMLYFDSFGFYPPTNVLEKVKNEIYYSTIQLQDLNSTACGWFCICCILANIQNKYDYSIFLKRFNENNTAFNDNLLFFILHRETHGFPYDPFP